jgi:hypothetical protein
VTANGRHLALSGRRGTPPDWVEMSRTALGGRIELDPMSEPAFNEIVRAERIYTEADDCFRLPWYARTVFLNPHGGLVVEAWRKLSTWHRQGHITAAIWIGFSMEQLNLLADEVEHPMDFSMLVVRKRIAFLGEDLRVLNSPTHSNYVVGMGIPADRFEAAFAGRGRFSHGQFAIAREGLRLVADDEQFGGVG